jgi:signal transduction histidine kinase
MSKSSARALGWGLFALSYALTVGAAVLAYLARNETIDNAVRVSASDIAVGLGFLVFPAVGALIVSRHPSHAVGWIFAACGVAFSLSIAAQAWAAYASAPSAPLPGVDQVAWICNVTSPIAVPLLATLGVLLAPDGRPPSRRWRRVAYAMGASLVLIVLYVALRPGPLQEFEPVENPFGVGSDGLAWDALGAVYLLLPLSAVAAALSLVGRFRRAAGEDRQRLKWIVAGAAVLAIALVGTSVIEAAGGGQELFAVLVVPALSAYAAATGIAVLRHRLYDVDLLINRGLVYLGLTLCVVVLYVLIVGGLGLLLQERSEFWLSLVATALAAVLVQPARSFLQRRVNRLLYGMRDEPYEALSHLGERLEATVAPDAVLPAVVESLTEALRVPHAAIELDRPGSAPLSASVGERGNGRELVLPLRYRNEELGRLIVAPRSPDEEFNSADRRLLEDLTRQAGAAAQAVLLTLDLQRSRERLVSAREEERRRLRRELHDGVGPTLAGIALNIEACTDLLESDPQGSIRQLERLKLDTRETIDEIRRIVYALRPPTLDELGLIGALREQARRLSGEGSSGQPLRIDVAAHALPDLPAAVEVAAFRVASEGMANVQRHADARHCWIRLSCNAALHVEIADDGRGIGPDSSIGVGMTSMRERAAELGGELTIEPRDGGGTRVVAILPIAHE